MKRIGIISGLSAALALATSAALAQSAAAPTPPPAQSFNLQVTAADLAVIAKMLGKAPYEEAAPIFQKLQGQLQAQTAPKAEPSASTQPNSVNGPATVAPSAKAAPTPAIAPAGK